jgi:PAS domain S-box-containing protein
MIKKPTYEELAKRVKALEQEKLENNIMEKTTIYDEKGINHVIESGTYKDIHIREHELESIINADEIQSIMDEFCHLTNMVTAILDLKGKVIEATGWQDICVKFHRISSKTSSYCTESDLFLAKNLKPGEFVSYKCKNGLWDVVTPLYIANKHFGNIYTGQFFYDDDPIDEEFFINQAEVCGFDKDSYLDAVRRVPRYKRETINHLMAFLVKFTSYVSKIGLFNIQLGKEIYERRLTEEVLQHKTALLEAQLNSSIDGILIVDAHGKKILQNQRNIELWNIPQHVADNNDDGIQVQHVMRMTKNSKQFAEKVAHLYSNPDETSRDEIELTDGTILDRYSAPVLGNEGQNFGRIWTFRDITERKRSEEALLKGKEKYQSMIQNLMEGFYSVTVDGKLLDYNTEFTKILGLEANKDHVGVELPYFWNDPEDREVYIKELTKNGFIKGYEVNAKKSDGEKIVVRVNSRLIKDEMGRPLRIEGSFLNITERKLAEEAMRESEERFKALFEFAPDAYYLNDLDGILLNGNRAAENLLGYKREELVGNDFLQLGLLSPEDLPKAAKLLAMNLEGKATGPDEFTLKQKDGKKIVVEIRTTPINIKDNDVVLGIARDISERKHLEGRLRQSQKLEAVGTLAGGIAHDFNNILATIMGYCELALEDTKKGKATPKELQQILKSSQRAAKLVRQILTYSREMEFSLEPVDINSEVIFAANLLRQTIPRMIDIDLYLSESVALIKADDTQIQQVLLNLASNAKDAMPDGGKLAFKTELVQVDRKVCQVCHNEFSGEYILLSIRDTGEGMGGKTLEKIFDPFFTTKEVGKGTGLGLATVFGIVGAHEGHLTVDSQLDVGTTFNIYLPAIDENIEIITENKAIEDLPGGNETILLVDDEETVLEINNKMLHGTGYTVLASSTGEEALKTYLKVGDNIDLVILDLSMPGMGGHRCLKELLSLDPQAKVIISTGYSRDGDLRETMSSGAAALLPKPFSKSEMLKTVRLVLDS